MGPKQPDLLVLTILNGYIDFKAIGPQHFPKEGKVNI